MERVFACLTGSILVRWAFPSHHIQTYTSETTHDYGTCTDGEDCLRRLDREMLPPRHVAVQGYWRQKVNVTPKSPAGNPECDKDGVAAMAYSVGDGDVRTNCKHTRRK